MEDVDLVRLEPGNREHVEHAVGDVPAQLVQQRMGAGACNLVTMSAIVSPIPGSSAQPVLGDDAVERLDQRRERVRRALVGFRAEVIVAGERGAPA